MLVFLLGLSSLASSCSFCELFHSVQLLGRVLLPLEAIYTQNLGVFMCFSLSGNSSGDGGEDRRTPEPKAPRSEERRGAGNLLISGRRRVLAVPGAGGQVPRAADPSSAALRAQLPDWSGPSCRRVRVRVRELQPSDPPTRKPDPVRGRSGSDWDARPGPRTEWF